MNITVCHVASGFLSLCVEAYFSCMHANIRKMRVLCVYLCKLAPFVPMSDSFLPAYCGTLFIFKVRMLLMDVAQPGSAGVSQCQI